MKFLAGLLIITAAAAGFAGYEVALPGYRYEFPRDYFNHPQYRTEWWYYTGNLDGADGRRYGFELTFFRVGGGDEPRELGNVWSAGNLYLAHLALSDLTNGHFYYDERLNRAGPGLAGVNAGLAKIWNGNWRVQWDGKTQRLQAIGTDFELALKMDSVKPVVIHGDNGVSLKAPGPGNASHYISIPRLQTDGVLKLRGKSTRVSGLSWMDHEFFTEHSGSSQAGWDWLSVQLNNGEDLMIYRLRRKDGTGDVYSSGTFVDRKGIGHPLHASDFQLSAGTVWRSSATGARYPIAWRLEVPSLQLSLDVTTPLPSQELVSKGAGPSYWEGAVDYRGTRQQNGVSGRGYLEMTGYAGAFEF